VRTDEASNCVAAGGVLGDVARQRVDADRSLIFRPWAAAVLQPSELL